MDIKVTPISEAFTIIEKAKQKYHKLFDQFNKEKREPCDCDRSTCSRCLGLIRLKEEMDRILSNL